MSNSDKRYMQLALAAALEAGELGEVPVGACLVSAEGLLIATASNRTIANCDPTAHAEILALRSAAGTVGNYRLTGVTLYSTIEPCVMCAGALVHARIDRLVFGARDERFGAAVSVFRLCDTELLNHQIELTEGVLENECRSIMQEFFRARRG